LTNADPTKTVQVFVGCQPGPTCETAPPHTTATPTAPPSSGSWFAAPIGVHLHADDATDQPIAASGVHEIRVYLTGGHGGTHLDSPCTMQLDPLHIEYCVANDSDITNLSTNGLTTVWY